MPCAPHWGCEDPGMLLSQGRGMCRLRQRESQGDIRELYSVDGVQSVSFELFPNNCLLSKLVT